MLSDIQAIVLAAGTSSDIAPKLNEKICGQELIVYPIKTLHALSIPITLVMGSQKTTLKKTIEHHPIFSSIHYVEHEPSDYASLLSQEYWQYPHILIMPATIASITQDTIKELYETHTKNKAAISFIGAHHEEPSLKYRSIIKKKQRLYIRNYNELSAKELHDHCCIASGIYLISRSFLAMHARQIATIKHLADVVNIATDAGQSVSMVIAPFDQIRSADTYQELWAVEHIQRAQLIRFWMDHGVRFSAPQTVQIDLAIEIGAGSFIGNSAHILQGTIIGTNTIIDSFSILQQATIGNNSTIHPHSIIKNSTIGDHTQIGPFAHIQDTIVGNHCALGNFVETKRTKLANHSKAKHLTYLGDAQIGTHVNIGAGTITCNYDGKNKHTTHIEDHVFIGSNNSLVAPVTIKKEAFTAAGSVITHDVPAHALAIGRARQVNKEGYTHTEDTKQEEEYDDTKKSLSFIGAVKSSNIDL